MTTIESLEQFRKVELQAWARHDDKQKIIRVRPVIAITRMPGCNGEFIARTLARVFGLVLHDWEIVEQIARDAHVSTQVVATLDKEVRSELDDWLAGFAGSSNLSSYNYIQCLRKVLFTIATHGNAVILGRGANFLLPPEKKTLGLCLVAPLEAKVKNVMQKFRLSREKALSYIVQTEREQCSWVKKHGQADINDAACYHLVINTALVKVATIVQLVKKIIRARGFNLLINK